MEIKIATRQCLDQKGQQRRFHYYLTIDQEETPRLFCENYGVRIAEELGDESSLSGVTTAQITYAARNSDFDGFDIKEGDYLALKEGKLFGTDGSLQSLLEKLAADAAERNASFISLYFGEDVKEEDAQEAGALFESACPGAEVMVLSGGQPVYYYIISMEYPAGPDRLGPGLSCWKGQPVYYYIISME